MFRLSFTLSRLCLSPSQPTVTNLVTHESVRFSSSFYTRLKADQLWRGAMGVSKTSAKRGRKGGGGKIMRQDLSRGQRLGTGRTKMIWPGLNAPVVAGRQSLVIRNLGADDKFDENLLNARSRMRRFAGTKVHPLDRGWSGTKMGGRWVGPPDPVNGEEFVGFDTKVIFLKPIFKMTALFGKYKRFSCLTVTGNSNGLAGFAVARHLDNRQVLSRSKNKAAQRLQYMNLFEGCHLYHSFYSKFYATELFVRKMPKGYGVRAHRVVTAICEVLGLTDIYCKVEGAVNYIHITRAFFNGLNKQKTYQQMADEKRLNVVELVGKYNYPIVLARPTDGCRTENEISPDEILDYDMYIYNGRVIKPPKEKVPFYTKEKSWVTYIKKWQYEQSRQQSRVDLMSKYGTLDSYLTLKDKERLNKKRKEFYEQKSAEATEEQQEEKI